LNNIKNFDEPDGRLNVDPTDGITIKMLEVHNSYSLEIVKFVLVLFDKKDNQRN